MIITAKFFKLFKFFAIIAILIASSHYTNAAIAQDNSVNLSFGENGQIIQEAAPRSSLSNQKTSPAIRESKNAAKELLNLENIYVDLDYDNLINIYWALGKINTLDPQKIDDYLLLTQCDDFQKHYNNDIKWHEIRTETQKKLQKIRKEFPTKVNFILPITLERYDLNKKSFSLNRNSAFVNSRQIPLVTNFNDDKSQFCGQPEKYFEDYPSQIILSLDTPFTFDRLEIDQNAAQRLIDNPVFQQNERQLYMQFFVDLRKYRGDEQIRTVRYSYITATIDHVKIFQEPELLNEVAHISEFTHRKNRLKESFR